MSTTIKGKVVLARNEEIQEKFVARKNYNLPVTIRWYKYNQ